MLQKYRKIDSIDNGNCLFNALALGLCDQALTGVFNQNAFSGRYTRFLDSTKEKLGLEGTWPSFLEYIKINQSNPRQLQLQLAPLLRDLVHSLKQDQAKEGPILTESDIQVFQTEFRDHVNKSFGLPLDERFEGGDIYSRHSNITSKFSDHTTHILHELSQTPAFNLADLKEGYSRRAQRKPLEARHQDALLKFDEIIQKRIEKLVGWFKNDGYSEFLNFMRSPGQWAGDIESREVGAYFGCDIIAYNREDFIHQMYFYHGTIPAHSFTQEQIAVLIQRGIVNKETQNGNLVLLKSTPEEVSEKLSEIPNGTDVFHFWNTERLEHKNRIAIPTTWLSKPQLILALASRGIIARDKSQFFFYSDLTLESIVTKLGALDNLHFFLKLWKESYIQQPEIVISNPAQSHWFYLQPRNMNQWDLSSLDVSDKTTTEELLSKLLTTQNSLLQKWSTKPAPASQQPAHSDLLAPDSNIGIPRVFSNNGSPRASQGYPGTFLLEYQQQMRIFLSDDESNTVDLTQLTRVNSPVLESDGHGVGGKAEEENNHDDQTDLLSNAPMFRTNRTPPQTPLSSSPPREVTKKMKVVPRKQNLLISIAHNIYDLINTKESALRNRSILLQNQATNKLLHTLMEEFGLVYTAETITNKLSCLLVDPNFDNQLKAIDPEISKKVFDFVEKFRCEILLQAQQCLSSQFLTHFIGMEFSDFEIKSQTNPAIKFLLDLHELIQKPKTKLESFQQLLNSYDLSTLPRHLTINTKNSSEKIADLVNCIMLYKHVFNQINAQTCAYSLLHYFKEYTDDKSCKYREIFTDISKNGLTQIGHDELNDLTDFMKQTLPSGHDTLIKAIEAFVKLFRNELAEPSSYHFKPKV